MSWFVAVQTDMSEFTVVTFTCTHVIHAAWLIRLITRSQSTGVPTGMKLSRGGGGNHSAGEGGCCWGGNGPAPFVGKALHIGCSFY